MVECVYKNIKKELEVESRSMNLYPTPTHHL